MFYLGAVNNESLKGYLEVIYMHYYGYESIKFYEQI